MVIQMLVCVCDNVCERTGGALAKKQFSILQPATKTRFEIGLNLKGEKPAGILEEIKAANSMCSHKINLNSLDEVNSEVLNWVRAAYEKSI